MTGLVDIEDETPLPGIEWNLKINREEAGRFGADIVSVGALITMITDGVLIGTFRPDDSRDEVDIRARLPESQRALSRLEDLRLPTEKGLVPIRNFVEREAQTFCGQHHPQGRSHLGIREGQHPSRACWPMTR